MTQTSSRKVIVSGYLGAGKSHLIARLADGGAVDAVEANALEVPATAGSGDAPVLVVVDGVNLTAVLDDPLVAPLVRAQIGAADAAFVSRGDVADVSAARAALAHWPSLSVPESDEIDALVGVLADLSGSVRSGATPLDHSGDFATWSYSGSAVLTDATLDEFLASRPKGAYRIFGKVRGPSKGIDIQVFGRGRQTAPVAQPKESTLTAIGPALRFRPSEMDLAFSTAVVAASYGRGIIACR